MHRNGHPIERKKKVGDRTQAFNAEAPGQVMNVDLCFVPLEHTRQEKLPAVSGSSGHLVVEGPKVAGEERRWPGQVFGQVDYEEAIQTYAQQTRDRLVRKKIDPVLPEKEPTQWRKGWEARAHRHAILQQRRQEDSEWRIERQAHHRIVDAYRALTRIKRAAVADEWQAQKAAWALLELARKERLANRKLENLAWHADNRERKQSTERFWLAVLVIVDNCSRQCYGLPVFESGAKVTAAEVTQALYSFLPRDLAYLISDQGSHFRSNLLTQLAKDLDFLQVPIYRHRPQTNGIAERFVRTLKEDLREKNWSGAQGLAALLTVFRAEYNNRPHQSLSIPGLSPNEFANRVWLM